MLLQSERAKSRWVQTDRFIEHWKNERQALLVIYNQTCQSLLSKKSPPPEQLQTLCQHLVHYALVAHLTGFTKLAEANQICNPKNAMLDRQIVKNIGRTSDFVEQFDAKYANTTEINLTTFSTDLSKLGEQLADRMDWEDILFRNYVLETSKHLEATPETPARNHSRQTAKKLLELIQPPTDSTPTMKKKGPKKKDPSQKHRP